MATGADFPDALAGAALAGWSGAPMYITGAACVPEAVHEQITAVGATSRVVLGGTSVVSQAAANNTVCTP